MGYHTINTSDFINKTKPLEYLIEQIIENTHVNVNIDSDNDICKLVTLLNKFLLRTNNVEYSDLKHLIHLNYTVDEYKEKETIDHVWDSVLTEQIKYYIHK